MIILHLPIDQRFTFKKSSYIDNPFKQNEMF